jgi:hypothetical protein
MMLEGEGGPANQTVGIAWLIKAAHQGHEGFTYDSADKDSSEDRSLRGR